MIDFYYWPVPNGQKTSIAMAKIVAGDDLIFIDIGQGVQFPDNFLAIINL
ncbi:MAG: hypothetical protein O2985_12135 [Proteobacteria bacterium]|nr:hypothetical protein [Pseudomonadota bacterium]